MRASSTRLLAVLVLALACTMPAKADEPSTGECSEKIFFLKNGRKIRAQLVEENPTQYVIRSPGGRSTLARGDVVRIEEPPTGRPFLEPPKKAREPAAPTREPRKESAKATPAPETKLEPKAPAASRGEVATAAEIADAKKILGGLPPAGDPTLEKALADASKKATLAALVGILSESPVPIENGQISDKRPDPRAQTLAAQLLRRAPAEEVRPLVAKAVSIVALERGQPTELVSFAIDLRDDAAGTLEAAFLARVLEHAKSRVVIDDFTRGLQSVGRPEVAPKLYDGLLEASLGLNASSLGRTIRFLLDRSPNPDPLIEPLAALVDPGKLPSSLVGLAEAAMILGKAKHGLHLLKLERLIQALDALTRNEENTGLVDNCQRSVMLAIARLDVPEARDVLVRAVDSSRRRERRIIALSALTQLKVPRESLAEIMEPLVRQMSEIGRSDAELNAYASTLSSLSGARYGTDVDAWAKYVSDLENEGR